MKILAFVPPLAGILLLSSALVVRSLEESPSAPQPVQMNLPLAQQNDAFAPLRSFLADQNWQAADRETRRLIERWVHPNGDLFGTPLASNIPADALQTIDRLWLDASNGRFGFSVQQRIWQEVSAQYPNDTNAAVQAFGRRVGWVRPTPDRDNFISPDWFTEPELKNSLDAPVGHFPWPGISWERIQNLLNAQSCGSCTIDAMYLQGDRFSRYIPALYNRVKVALATPSQPEVEAWQTLRPRFAIDLNSLYPGNRCPVQTVDRAISPNSQLLAVSSYSYERACGGGVAENSTLALWNAQRGNRIVTLVRGQAMEAYAYRGQSQEPPTEQDRIVGDVANAIAFTPDSRLIAAGLSNGTVRLWATDTGRVVRTLSGHRYAVRAIAISTDGKTLASASSDQTIKLWNLQTGQLTRTINLKPADGIVHTVQMSPDGTRLATATHRNKLQLWNLSTGQIVRTFVDETTNQPHWMPITFSPNSRLLATSDIDHSVKLWNATTGARIITLQGHQEAVKALAFSPDSRTLASSSADYQVQLWNLQTYQVQRTLNAAAGVSQSMPNPGHLDFTADGRILATSAIRLHPVHSEPLLTPGATLWNVATGQPLTTVDSINAFSFSPNSQFLLTNGSTLQVWQP